MRRGLCGGGDVDDPDESLGEAAAAHSSLTRAVDLAAAGGYVDPGFFRVAADAIEAFVAVVDGCRAFINDPLAFSPWPQTT